MKYSIIKWVKDGIVTAYYTGGWQDGRFTHITKNVNNAIKITSVISKKLIVSLNTVGSNNDLGQVIIDEFEK